jgi:hypothetical protein
MNSMMERWVRTCRRELLDRTLIWNRDIYCMRSANSNASTTTTRPHQGLANARPLYPLTTPISDPDEIAQLRIRRRDRLGGILHEYEHAA